MGVKVTYTTVRPGVEMKHINDLKPGDVFMSGKHDPYNPREGAGLYLVTRNSPDIFCVSFKGTALSRESMEQSLVCTNGMVTMFDAEVRATVRKNDGWRFAGIVL